MCASTNPERMPLQTESGTFTIISSMRPSHLSTPRQSLGVAALAAWNFSNTSRRVTHVCLCPFHAAFWHLAPRHASCLQREQRLSAAPCFPQCEQPLIARDPTFWSLRFFELPCHRCTPETVLRIAARPQEDRDRAAWELPQRRPPLCLRHLWQGLRGVQQPRAARPRSVWFRKLRIAHFSNVNIIFINRRQEEDRVGTPELRQTSWSIFRSPGSCLTVRRGTQS